MTILAGCSGQHLDRTPPSVSESNISEPFASKIPVHHAEPALSSKALPELGPSSTLEDYLAYAALNNAGLEAAFYRWKAALDQIPQARALPDPDITYGKYVRQSDMQMNQEVGIMQMFPWFGTIEARTDAAYANAQAARQELEAAKLELYRQVKKEFHEFLYLKESIDIAEQNLELIKHFEQVALTRYAVSTGTHPDIIRAQIELARLDEILVSLRELKKPQVARLNALLNPPAQVNLEWPQKPPFNKPDISYAQLIDILKKKNPQLVGLDWMIESAKNEIKLAEKRNYPDIGIGVEWTAFDNSADNSGRDAVAMIFKINLPLWHDSYQAAERQARATASSIKRKKTDTANALAAEVAGVLYDLEESQRKITLYEDIIPKAEQLVNASETAYKAGTVDFLSLIDSQRMLLQYNLDYQRVLTDNQQRLAELEALVGEELAKTGNLVSSETVLNKEDN
ncbi:MAG: TolC family protein [Planctomycetales bacterium]|nr:TolC family protein [Planctomycetales bacterium]